MIHLLPDQMRRLSNGRGPCYNARVQKQQQDPTDWRPNPTQLQDLENRLATERRRREAAERHARQLEALLHEERLARQRVEMELLLQRKGRLSLWDPRDYVRLLWWLLVTPERLRAYEAYQNGRGLDDLMRQGSWLASTLLWLPLLAWFAWATLTGSIPLPGAFLALTFVGGLGGWLLDGWLGSMDNALAALLAVFVTAVLALIIGAILSGLALGLLPIPGILLWSTAVFLSAAAGLSTGAILKLQVTDAVAALVALTTAVSLLFLAAQHSEPVIFFITIIVAGLLLPAFTQWRYRRA